MLIRPAFTKDLHEIAFMYRELLKDFYPINSLGSDYHFYKAVISWIDNGNDIVVSEKDNIVTGFYMAYVDNMGGLTQATYYCSELFIKKEFRKSRAFYLLQKNLILTAKTKKLNLIADAVQDIEGIYKKLGGVKTSTRYIKEYYEQ